MTYSDEEASLSGTNESFGTNASSIKEQIELISKESNPETKRALLDDLYKEVGGLFGQIQTMAMEEQRKANAELQAARALDIAQQENAYKTAEQNLNTILKQDIKTLPKDTQQLLESAQKTFSIIKSVKGSGKPTNVGDLAYMLEGMHKIIEAKLNGSEEELVLAVGEVDKLNGLLQTLPQKELWSKEFKTFLAIAATVLALALVTAALMVAVSSFGIASPLSLGVILATTSWLGATLTSLGFGVGASLTGGYTAAMSALTSPIYTIPGVNTVVSLWQALTAEAVVGASLGAAIVNKLTGTPKLGRDDLLLKLQEGPESKEDSDKLLKGANYGVVAIAPDGMDVTSYMILKRGKEPEKLLTGLDDDLIKSLNEIKPFKSINVSKLESTWQDKVGKEHLSILEKAVAKTFKPAPTVEKPKGSATDILKSEFEKMKPKTPSDDGEPEMKL